MKKLLVLIVLLITSVNFSQVKDIYKSANEAYRNKDYNKALSLYSKIVNQDYESSDLYYNLGNTYYKLNNIGKSILYYEKALKLDPNNEDVKYNLKIVKARTKDNIKVLPKLFIVKFWEAMYNMLSVNAYKIILITLNILIAVFLFLIYKTKFVNTKKLFTILFGIFLSINVLFIIMFYSKYNNEKYLKYGICLVDEYSAKVSPDQGSNNAFVIHEGIKFKLEEKVGDWRKIILEDGKVAWVEEKIYEDI